VEHRQAHPLVGLRPVQACPRQEMSTTRTGELLCSGDRFVEAEADRCQYGRRAYALRCTIGDVLGPAFTADGVDHHVPEDRTYLLSTPRASIRCIGLSSRKGSCLDSWISHSHGIFRHEGWFTTPLRISLYYKGKSNYTVAV